MTLAVGNKFWNRRKQGHLVWLIGGGIERRCRRFLIVKCIWKWFDNGVIVVIEKFVMRDVEGGGLVCICSEM